MCHGVVVVDNLPETVGAYLGPIRHSRELAYVKFLFKRQGTMVAGSKEIQLSAKAFLAFSAIFAIGIMLPAYAEIFKCGRVIADIMTSFRPVGKNSSREEGEPWGGFVMVDYRVLSPGKLILLYAAGLVRCICAV